MHRLLALSLVASLALTAEAQEPPAPTPPMSSVSVYLDCQTFGCDFDYFRTEMTMVDWVRDRAAADIHLLMTGQTTGSGGQEYTLTFIGLRQFAGLTDTLKYVSPPSTTDDERRKALAGLFRLGFVRYFARLPQGAKVTVTFGETRAVNQTSSTKDPWKAWVFRIGTNGWGSREESYRDQNFNYNLNADRVTSGWKTQIRFNEQRFRSKQFFKDEPPYVVRRESFNRTMLQVRSLGDHWSAGARGAWSSSLFENHDRVLRGFAAIEYNVFPYNQSTRRALKLEYDAGYSHFTYIDTTIFDKTREGMPLQRLLLGYATRQPWGSVDVGSTLTHYLNDLDRYRSVTWSEVSVRIIKGFDVFGYAEYVKKGDGQFNLSKRAFSDEDILTRQYQLPSSYSLWFNFGISYTFGSVFNSVVNPRMTSGNF